MKKKKKKQAKKPKKTPSKKARVKEQEKCGKEHVDCLYPQHGYCALDKDHGSSKHSCGKCGVDF